MDMKKTVLVTGASSGFGYETVKLFQEKGWNVVATLRNPSGVKELELLPDVLVLQMDVTSRESISEAVAKGIAAFGSLDVVVNNAGYGSLGVLEAAPDEEVRKQMEVNLFGVINVIKEVLPSMRSKRSGVIVNVSSVGGRVTFPYFSLYHASKYAIEGLTEGLQYELNPLGIQLKIVEPGGYRTNFAGSSLQTWGVGNISDYEETFEGFKVSILERSRKQNDKIVEVAEKIYEAATSHSDQLRFPVGADALHLLEERQRLSDAEFKHLINERLNQ